MSENVFSALATGAEELRFDVAVIGGGPAGMAAALAAEREGASVVLLERDVRLGGILNQCIHNGFGLHYFKEELTGPEYADRFVKRIESSSVTVMTEAMVLSLSRDLVVTALSPSHGYVKIVAGAVVLAMGCRERTAGAICLTGTRPVGIYTAGMAQKLMNVEGYTVGKEVVVLGSGDIGLIMARRMTFEGAQVKLVLELMPYSSGLKRNIVQCLEDFAIPLKFSHTVTRVVGDTRLEGIYYAQVDGKGKPIPETEQFVSCDTLLLSVGLIPENDLVQDTGVELSTITSGAVVDEHRQTNIDGLFSAGNVLHVHDLVDNVSAEADVAGTSAAKYAKGLLKKDGYFAVSAKDGVRYALPQRISRSGDGDVKVYFRVGNVYKGARLTVACEGKVIYSKKYMILSPGEMESVVLKRDDIVGDITLGLEV